MRGAVKGLQPYLEDARSGIAAYFSGTAAGGVEHATDLHLLRLTTGREILLRLGAATGSEFYPEARLTDTGLFYAPA
jgi:hypothetical protein